MTTRVSQRGQARSFRKYPQNSVPVLFHGRHVESALHRQQVAGANTHMWLQWGMQLSQGGKQTWQADNPLALVITKLVSHVETADAESAQAREHHLVARDPLHLRPNAAVVRARLIA